MPYRVLLIAQMLALASCAVPTAPAGVERFTPNAVTDAAAQRVGACLVQEGLPLLRPYASLRLWLDPTTELGGYGRGRDVYIQARLAAEPVLWSHEFLHLMAGLPGKTATDHPAAFWRCGLDPRQI